MKFNELMERGKKFINNHKDGIIYYGGTLLVGYVLGSIITRKHTPVDNNTVMLIDKTLAESIYSKYNTTK